MRPIAIKKVKLACFLHTKETDLRCIFGFVVSMKKLDVSLHYFFRVFVFSGTLWIELRHCREHMHAKKRDFTLAALEVCRFRAEGQ